MKKILFKLCYVTLFLSLLLVPLSLSALAAEGDPPGAAASGSTTPGTGGATDSGGSSGSGGTTNTPILAGISLSAPSKTVECTGETAQKNLLISPTFIPGDFVPSSGQLEWQILSSEPGDDVVTITPNDTTHTCTVTGLKPGKVVIRATVGDYHADWAVEVSGAVLSESEIEVTVNTNKYLTVAFYGRARDVSASSWEWRVEDRTKARVNATGGAVTGVAVGETNVICSYGAYSATCKVTVKSAAARTLTASLDKERRLDFSTILSDLKVEDTTYLTSISVPPSQGTLYNGYVSEPDTGHGVASSDMYYFDGDLTKNQVSNITFIPKPDFSGDAVINYIAVSNSTGGQTPGEIRITVTKPDDVSFTSEHGEAIHFQAEAFSLYTQQAFGRPISSVTFSAPDTKYGYLYYNYTSGQVYESNVPSDRQYYRTSNPSIDNVAFVPTDGYEGTFTMTYRGVDTTGYSFNGTIRITVGSSGADNEGNLSYRVVPGKRVYFRVEDFNDASRDATDSRLDYIRFASLPSSDQGTLYCDDTKVTTSTSYYRTGRTRPIDEICFVAADNLTGTVSIPFTGTANDGTTFDGTVKITATDNATDIFYTTRPGRRVDFDMGDFNDASYGETGRRLDYVRFTSLPASSKGVLYYDTDVKVSTSNAYYRSGSSSTRLLEDVSFVPKNGYTGPVTIPYVGYDTSHEKFEGMVTITVSESGTTPGVTDTTSSGTTSYYTDGQPITLRGTDFSYACQGLLAAPLSTVQITPPPSSAGKLYTSYTSPTVNRVLTPGRACDLLTLSQVVFVPKADYSGTLRLYYTGTDQQGNTCGNTFTIHVSPPSYSNYFYDMDGSSWAVPAVDFLYRNQITRGTSASAFSPLAPMKRGDFVLMLYRAFSLPFAGSESFPDVPETYHYAEAVAAAKTLGIVSGYSDGNFHPADAITRQDAAVMLYRCMRWQNRTTPGSANDLAKFTDRNQVSAFAVEAMGALVRDGVFTGNGNQLLPRSALNRAQMAAILYRALT